MKISAERENPDRTQLAAAGFFSQRMLLSLSGQHKHGPEWVYSILHCLPDGDVVRNTGLSWGLYNSIIKNDSRSSKADVN